MKNIIKVPVFFFRFFYPFKVFGRENIPEGKAIIVCNHFRAIDCGFIAAIYKEDISFLAKKELFKNKLITKILKASGAIGIDREKPEIKSLLEAVKVLRNGQKLAIFPEGSRNKSNTNVLQPLKGGSAIFALRSKCPIIPVMMLKKASPFRKNYFIIGKPFELRDFYDKKLTDDDIDNINLILSEKMNAEQTKLKAIIEETKQTKKKRGKNKNDCENSLDGDVKR